MNILAKIKAGALQYVLVISVIIAIIIFAFISLIYLQQKLTIKNSFTKDAIANAQFAFEYIKHKQVPYNKEISIEISKDKITSTTFEKKHWGFFDIGITKSKVKNEFFQKVALLGTQNQKRDALFLKDNSASLVLVGNTKIAGNASLPKQGVKTGNIGGVSYYGNRFIYGQQKQSTMSLPRIQNLEYLKNLQALIQNRDYESFELKEGAKIYHSFSEGVKVYKDANAIYLRDISLSGHLIVFSNSRITVSSTATLQDIILIAPEIHITSGVIGNFQAIASKKIIVNTNVNLDYPSALVVLDKESNTYQRQQLRETRTKENAIDIQNESNIKGIVLYVSENTQSNYNTQISISENASVTGEVYCTKNLELLGKVLGTVYTDNFIIKKRGGTYVNHIFNGEIDVSKLPTQYAGLQIRPTSNQVAKWVN